MKEKGPSYIVPIPTEYLPRFKSNSSRAWQSFGSFAQHSDAPYFDNIRRISESVSERENPFLDDSYTFKSWFTCEDNFYRYMHIDLGLTGDACGIAMCHIADWTHP